MESGATKKIDSDKFKYLIIGSGIAGLVAALILAEHGQVLVITKTNNTDSNSIKAQGGIAAAIDKSDSPELHFADTIHAGGRMCNTKSVQILVNTAVDAIDFLKQTGVIFDKHLGLESAHSIPRILHANGDTTGLAIISQLLQAAKQHPNIVIKQQAQVIDLLIDDTQCVGAIVLHKQEFRQYYASVGVVLATGGCGQLYKYTTNHLGSTGDGIAIARRAGAEVVDLEFIQFHPTALAIDSNPMFLISEAVRGEGAILVNNLGDRFMSRYHVSREMAPRDIVARAIFHEMSLGHTTYLDATNLADKFPVRFPNIYKSCMSNSINPCTSLIPVKPAAHFIMGGVTTDIDGQSSIPRLFACGEVANTGVHGANRLASNSLLEGVVFAMRAAKKLAGLPPMKLRSNSFRNNRRYEKYATIQNKEIKQTIQEIMWQYAGITRTKDGLEEGLRKILLLNPAPDLVSRNMITLSEAIIRSALKRPTSVGAHHYV